MQYRTKAIISHAMAILNLLFPFVYILIVIFWFKNKSTQNKMLKASINDAFVLSTVTFVIFVSLVMAVLIHFGFKSTFTLVAGEIYYMLIIPLSFYPAIKGIAKNNAGEVYYYPLIGQMFSHPS